MQLLSQQPPQPALWQPVIAYIAHGSYAGTSNAGQRKPTLWHVLMCGKWQIQVVANDEQDLTLLRLVGMHDPPRLEVAAAMQIFSHVNQQCRRSMYCKLDMSRRMTRCR